MIFEQGYYINSTITAYEDYTKKDYSELAENLIATLKQDDQSTVLDYGCATGALVAALRDKQIHVVGTDISFWAVKYGRVAHGLDKHTLMHFNRQLLEYKYTHCLFFDVLEHIETAELQEIFSLLRPKIIAVRVPVSAGEGGDFVLPIHRIDKTHIQCHSKWWWHSLFSNYGYVPKYTFDESSIYDSEGVLAGVYERE